MIERPFLIDKPPGATPLQALTVFRAQRGIDASVKMAYAGRLDPLASGVLPILHGAQLANQEEYWYLPKEYEASLLLGIATDSYDLLGMPTVRDVPAPSVERITSTVRGMVGKIDLSVPVYSSHRLEGKPLFAWARESEDGPAVVPVRRMTISQIDITGISDVSSADILEYAHTRIALVEGDFRQDAIRGAWEAVLPAERFYPVVHLSMQCASGTYVRSVVNEIGRRLGCGAVVSNLRRTRVGPWRITDSDVVRPAWPVRPAAI